MARKLFWLRKQNAEDKKGERLPIVESFKPKWQMMDAREQVNYYQSSMNALWLVMEWLLTTLLNKGWLSIDDFANYPLINKIDGELIEAKTDQEIRDGA